MRLATGTLRLNTALSASCFLVQNRHSVLWSGAWFPVSQISGIES
jgi:hypothetical protein